MLLGLATGDALGTTNEFCPRQSAQELTTIIGGGPFALEAGKWTDDTSMALCLADALLAQGRYDSTEVMRRYAAWHNEGYRSSTGHCFDIGIQISHALETFHHDPSALVAQNSPRSTNAGNGCIMRLAPVIIAGFPRRDPRDIIKMARISARETHYSEEAEAATEVFAALLTNAMNGHPKDEILNIGWASTGTAFDDCARKAISTDPHLRAASQENTSGYVIHGLALAVWGLMDFSSFTDAALAIANLGGDADTNAAIFGQLGGAFYGVEGIPRQWRSLIYEGGAIQDLADHLLNMTISEQATTRFEEDFYL